MTGCALERRCGTVRVRPWQIGLRRSGARPGRRPDVEGKTRLVLVDALRPLCDKRPQADPRYLRDYNGLIAGTDPVATDTVGLNIIVEKRRQLRGEPWPLSPPPLCVAAADEQYRLGTSRMEEIALEVTGWKLDPLV